MQGRAYISRRHAQEHIPGGKPQLALAGLLVDAASGHAIVLPPATRDIVVTRICGACGNAIPGATSPRACAGRGGSLRPRTLREYGASSSAAGTPASRIPHPPIPNLPNDNNTADSQPDFPCMGIGQTVLPVAEPLLRDGAGQSI